MDKFNEARESINDFKGVLQIPYDYYKHQSTLSIASIGAILAFIVKIFPSPNLPILAVILAVLSLLFLMVCLCVSLDGMAGSGTVSLYLTGIRSDMLIEKDSDKLISKITESIADLNKTIKKLKGYDRIIRYTFIVGVMFFFASACIFLISNY